MTRLFALLPFQNEMQYLPGYFKNVVPQVDGIIALNDKSTDGSMGFVAKQPKVMEIINTSDRQSWDDGENHKILSEAAIRHNADWVIGIDADERIEIGFRRRAEQEFQRGPTAYRIKILELWGSPRTYRVDGIWNQKGKPVLFQPRRDAIYDTRVFHGQWAPLNSMINGAFPEIDAIVYHLKMIKPMDRLTRMAKYLKLDPKHTWQHDYHYLVDESGLRLEAIKPGRNYAT